MENKVIDEIMAKRINWDEYTIDENGFLIRRQDGLVVGQYLYESEETTYSSLTEAILTMLLSL